MQRAIVDTDTAADDALALALASLSDRLAVEAVTVVAGNVPFDREVENAKYALSLVDAAETPVYEGAREPLLKGFEHAEGIHGEGGLGGDLRPETGIASAEGFGPDEIVRRCRESPGEVTVLCLGPLTNLALAYARDPGLPDLVDEVWVMGGAVNCPGNVTPDAEFNLWVDPDAARKALDVFEVTLVDWGLCLRDGALGDEVFAAAADAGTDVAEFFRAALSPLREADDGDEPASEADKLTSEADELTSEADESDGVLVPDALAVAALAYPELRGRSETYSAEVDEREGLTRGYLSADVAGATDEPATTRVIEELDSAGFAAVIEAMLRERDPDGGVE